MENRQHWIHEDKNWKNKDIQPWEVGNTRYTRQKMEKQGYTTMGSRQH